MTRRILSLLLTMTILLSPMTSLCEVSWQDSLRTWALKLLNVDKETAEKFMPIALLVAGMIAIGSFYYWASKKGGEQPPLPTGQLPTPPLPPQVEKIIAAKVPSQLTPQQVVGETEQPMPVKVVSPTKLELQPQKPELIQLPVYPQSKPDGGGPASCGYQTALRSMQVVTALSQNEQMDELKNTLMDPVPIEVYFGPKGSWRKEIIQRRKGSELKNHLDAEFLKTFKERFDRTSKQAELYRSALSNLEESMVNLAQNPETNTFPYDFTDDAIRKYILAGLNDMRPKKGKILTEDEAFTMAIIDSIEQKPEIIDEDFDYEKMKNGVLAQNCIIQLATFAKQIEMKPELQSDFDGDWLSDGEVERVWEYHRSDIIPNNVVCGFKAIANFDFVGRPEYADLDEVTPYIQEHIKNKDFNQPWQMFQVFAMGTMQHMGDKQGTRGHWYPLVMHQNKQGNRTYYVMDSSLKDPDSLTNKSRLNDPNVWKIINLIEK